MAKYNPDNSCYELSRYEQFQVQWKTTNLMDDETGEEYTVTHGYWMVTAILYPIPDSNSSDPIMWRLLYPQTGIEQYVDSRELHITPETGHRKHCIASAMISYIENYRDAEDISTQDFASTFATDNTAWQGAHEYLLDGYSTCICLTTKGLI